MHTILHKLANGGVGDYPPNPKVMAVMMGSDLRWSSERIAHEISMFTLGADGWPGFSLAFATEWVSALSNGGLTEAAALDLFARRIRLRRGYTQSAVVEGTTLPYHFDGDRYFRNAIRWDDTILSKCRCDMVEARLIHMDHIRKARNAEFERRNLDHRQQTALATGDLAAARAIEAEKQRLRDIPQTFVLTPYTTPETLKAAWPVELPRG
jgi:hypothetical protein